MIAPRGASDAAYIRKVINVQRKLELSSRAVLLLSLFPPAWLVGTAGLSVAKILENMEIGHNVMHGQWDWMRDPKIHSTNWEWDHASPSEQWKHSHNELHHTYTNVVGKDNDLGYGIMRVDEDQRWYPLYLAQPLWNFVNAMLLRVRHRGVRPGARQEPGHQEAPPQPGVQGAHQAGLQEDPRPDDEGLRRPPAAVRPVVPAHAGRQLTANVVRNVWTHSVIMCGHFPEGVETFEKKSIEGETRGEWYLRQMLGSANISGGKAMHIMTGNLSYQIEHHLFPDLPSNRYQEIAPKVQAIFEEYGLTYTTGPLPKQVASAWAKVIRLSLPNDFARTVKSRLTGRRPALAAI